MSKERFLLNTIAALLGIFLAGAASAQNPSGVNPSGTSPAGISRFLGKSDKPVRIQAERLEADNQAGVLIFTGSVLLRQGDLVLSTDRVEAYFNPQNREVTRITATGNVKMSQGDRIAVGDKAEYDVPGEMMVLTGSPRLIQGEDQVEGERIRVDLTKNRYEVESARARVGSQRLKQMKEKKSPAQGKEKEVKP
ncbi:MAG: lipopolysaccharide transport periplasmic protein LptA [Proteobacteria bacterium]|nr:lipopolysaccharide transport periplasmic protein LptA [Pseudomonadota bacterium]